MVREVQNFSGDDPQNWNTYQRAYTVFGAALTGGYETAQALSRIVNSELVYTVRQNLMDSDADIVAGITLLGGGLVQLARTKRSGVLGIGAGFLAGAGYKRLKKYMDSAYPRAS